MVFKLVLVFFLPFSQALSWLYAPSGQKTDLVDPAGTNDGFPPAELAAILQSSHSFDAYSKKPDCFRRAASQIQVTCDMLEMSEDERVKAALSMTLCEIATADHYSIPLECSSFHTEVDNRSRGHPGQCVSALSRSAQYWSSYSGYLREVSQLCFAFRRWNDIDTAREVHRNATIASIAVLKHLSERELRMQQAWDESDHLLRDMRSVLDQLRDSGVAIDLASGMAVTRFDGALNEIIDAYKHSLREISDMTIHSHTTRIDQVDASMTQTLRTFVATLDSIAPNMERTFNHYLNTVHTVVGQHLEGIDQLAGQVTSRMIHFQHTFDGLQSAITAIGVDVRHVGVELETQIRVSDQIQEKQLTIATTADTISSALTELAVMAHEEMQNLNVTISEVKESLQEAQYHNWSTVLWSWFQEASMHFLGVRSAHFDRPLFRFLYNFMRALRVVFAFASSMLMTAFVLLASARNLFTKRLRHVEEEPDIFVTSMGPDTTRAKTRTPASWTEFWPLDMLRSDRPRARLPVDPGYDRSSRSATFGRRARLSRIPDRLCNPSR